ncbi:hypothetical protein BurJ1DRAFT_0596 [Burkholderiales bacterium JOSHI_001]|nr:hypothetical protein BurJ1DRAFT_0596 [Burkholderiales bacterium JOSHI_001]
MRKALLGGSICTNGCKRRAVAAILAAAVALPCSGASLNPISPGVPASGAAADKVAAAAGFDTLVLDGKINSVSPANLSAGAPMMVTVHLLLARPTPAVVLERNLRLFLDSVPLVSAGAEPTAAASSAGAAAPPSAESNFQAQSPASTAFTRTITLMASAPRTLATGSSFNLSVYSIPDRRQIAAMDIQSLPPQGFVQELLAGQPKAVLPALGIAILVLGALAWFLYRQQMLNTRRETLMRQEVELERQRTQNLGRAVVSAADDANAEPTPPYPPQLPPELLTALEQRDLVIVTGVGVSAQSGLPGASKLWLNVIDRHAERISATRLDSLRALVMTGDTDAAVEAIVSLVGRDEVLATLKSDLIDSQPKPSHLHRLLAALPAAGLVDMTWDDLMPRAVVGPDMQVFGPMQTEGITSLLRGGQLALIKPLGDLRHPASVALTQREYRVVLSRAPELERAIAALFSTRTLLFLGFSLEGLEQFLSSLPAHLDSSDRRHCAVVPEGADRADLWQAGQGRRFGVKLVEYRPSADFRELVQAAEVLTERAARIGKASRADATGMSLAATRLSYLQLESIGIFRSLRVEFTPGWTLLLGNNGGGKSTILRAVTLALAGNDPRATAAGARLLRSGENLGTIELGMGNIRVSTSLVRDGTQVLIRSPQTTALQAGQVLVLAFPALRGVLAAQIKGPTSVPAANPSVDDVAPLLSGQVDSRLDNLQQWVVNAALRAETAPKGREMQMLQTFQQLISDMVPGGGLKFARIDRRTWQVILQADYGEVPFDGVSQGMSAILNWVGILLQRLYDVYPQSEHPERESAIALVDEIDAHLHPDWQRRLVTLTRKHFPSVQVIASSHSPLLAGAVEHTELRVVARDEASSQIRADMPREDLSGQKAEDILVSSLFSLQTTRSVEAEETIRRYFELFQRASLSDPEKLELDELARRLKALNFGPTLAMRTQIDQASSAADVALAKVSPADVQALQEKLRTIQQA